MLITAIVLIVLASLLHVYIWYLESVAWTTAARKVFGTTLEEAQATRELAYNQGFYNLFLAVIGLGGAIALALGHDAVGLTMLIIAAGSMVAAALVLFLSSPDKQGAALRQGTIPALGLIALGIWALI